jgi:LysM repeat protein
VRLERFFGFTGVDKPPEKPVNKPPFQPVQYQVKSGDSLGKIAQKFKKLNVSVEDIKRYNRLESDQIYPGQLLSINSPKTDGSLQRALPKKAASKSVAPPAHQDGADKPAAKKAPPPARTPTTFARSNDGDGAPLALVPPDNRRAPWMEVALGEAKKFKGKDESLIEKETNYAKEANTGQTTMTLEIVNGKKDYHAWCAAFVNWCLMRVGYRFDYLDGYDRGRAHGFFEIHGKKQTKTIKSGL